MSAIVGAWACNFCTAKRSGGVSWRHAALLPVADYVTNQHAEGGRGTAQGSNTPHRAGTPSACCPARTAEQYVASFEALLLEEAREAVRDEWATKAALGKAYEADVLE